MPVIKSAKKKLRKDKKTTARNDKLRMVLKKAVKEATKKPSETNLHKAVQVIDKSAKANIIHNNKAARLKSKLSKLTNKKPGKIQATKPVKAVKKTPPKTKTKK